MKTADPNRLNELVKQRTIELHTEIHDCKRVEAELEKHRKHLEELVDERTAELAEVNAELRLILDSVRAGICYKNTENTYLRVNKRTADVIGLPVEEIEGKSVYELFPNDGEHYFEDDLEVIGTGQSKLGIIQSFHTVSGEKRWALTDKIPHCDAQGKVIGLVVFHMDITQQKQAEDAMYAEGKKLKKIFEAMKDGVYIVNQQYDIEFVNSVLTKEFGPYEARKCYAYFHDREHVCPWCQNPKVFAGETVHWEWTSPKNGKTYDLIDTPLTNTDGSISKLEIFRDITDRIQAENQMEKRSAELRTIVKSMVGRENRMVGLKKAVKKLRTQLEEAGMTPVADDPLNKT